MIKKIKYYIILLLTGWRDVKSLGNVKRSGVYIACLNNRYVGLFYYSYVKNSWVKLGKIGWEEVDGNRISLIKKAPKAPWWFK